MRKLGVLLVAGLFLITAASCTTKKNEDVSAGTSTTEARSSENVDETTSTKKNTTTTDSSSTDSNADDIPALGDLGDCLEVSLAYAQLFLSSTFATDDQKAELEQQLGEIKGKVPADIRDDLDTISNGMANADGIVELGEFFDSDEYKAADENVQQYFDENCGTGSGDSGN